MGSFISKIFGDTNKLQEKYNIFGNRTSTRTRTRTSSRKRRYHTIFSEEQTGLLYSRKYEEIGD